MFKNRIILALALLAAAQGAVLVYWMTGSPAETGRWIQVGDDVTPIAVLDESGAPSSLVGNEPTVLLVFHSECEHCRRVAPEWRAWLEEAGGAHRVLAVSSEAAAPAAAYVKEHGWALDLRLVADAENGSMAHAMTSRTPWVFVIDERGAVLAEGQGSRLPELAAGLTAPRARRGEG